MKMDSRDERKRLFEEFMDNVKDMSNEIPIRNSKLSKTTIHPSKTIFGIGKYRVDIYFETMGYDFAKLGNTCKMSAERGSNISISLNERGYVNIDLYTPQTGENYFRKKMIYVSCGIHPRKLHKRNFIKKIFTFLIATQECVSIEGRPTLNNKIVFDFYLMKFKPYIRDDKYYESDLKSWLHSIRKYVVPVGLSFTREK